MQGITESMTLKFLAVAFVCVFIEIAVSLWTKKQTHSLRDSLCNLGILAIGRLSQPLFTVYILACLKAVESIAPYHLPRNAGTTIAAILLTDFIYYWQHRMSHTNRWLWFFHEVHHSSKFFNFTTSFRLHWLGKSIAPIYFAPLILIGFAPEQVGMFFVFNLFYQFILHTQLIGKIPLVEGILNTPSAHRVHHARNKDYFNKNFGGIFMVWDRMFGTYQAEFETPKFGTLGRFESNNPFTVQFHKLKVYNTIAKSFSKGHAEPSGSA